MGSQVIDFFYDVGSSYSYLAASQVEHIEKRTGASVRHRPFLLGGVFKATGNGPPSSVPAKLKWLVTDMQRWSELYEIPFHIPSRFPLQTLTTQRALTAAALIGGEPSVRALTMPLFRAYWGDDRDVSAPDVIAEIAASVGLDGPRLLEHAASQAAKDALRATTDEAVDRGAFGAPTFAVGDQLFWGNDRIVLLERHLARSSA